MFSPLMVYPPETLGLRLAATRRAHRCQTRSVDRFGRPTSETSPLASPCANGALARARDFSDNGSIALAAAEASHRRWKLMGRVPAHKAAGVLFVQNRFRSRNVSAKQPLFLRNGTAAIVMHKALYGTAAKRNLRSFIIGFANGSYPTLCCHSRAIPVREESARTRL